MPPSTTIQKATPVERPGTDTDSAQRTRTVRTRADLEREYVTGSTYHPAGAMLRALPAYIDDVSRDFGTDQYERMMTDPQVASVVKLLVMAVLADDLLITPAVEKDTPEFEAANKIAEFCKRNVASLERPIEHVLYELVEGAVVNGHKVAEQVYRVGTLDKESGEQLLLWKLKPKPQKSVAFVMDNKMNWVGVLYMRTPRPLSAYVLTGDEDILPREKFAILSHLGRDGDPRGRSILRAVYTPWYTKQQTWPQLIAYLARFGQPSVWGTTAPEANGDYVERDEAGAPIESTRMSPEEYMLAQLEKIRAGAAGAFPNGSTLELLEASGEGKPLFETLDTADRQIAKGVLLQTLASEEAKHQTRAASTVHQDVLGLLVVFVKHMVTSMLRQDILTPLVRYNYGDEAASSLVPQVSLGEVEQQDFATFAKGIASLALAGLIHDTQRPGIWEKLGLPAVDEEVLKEEEEERQREQAPPAGAPDEDEDEGDGDEGDEDQQPTADRPPARR